MITVLPERLPAALNPSLAPRPVVLVVDDEITIRGLLDIALRHQGFDVRLASSGDEAIAIYRDQAGAIGVVLMDVWMPGRTGPDTLNTLRELNPTLRCCFMSGDLGSYSEEDLLGRGATRVFHKPLPLGELYATLRRLCSVPH
jgi:DNA-binding NtrC family response regulator